MTPAVTPALDARNLTGADEATALAAVRSMGLRELYSLPREVVETWTGHPLTEGTARNARRTRLLTEWTKPVWRIKDVAIAANVRPDAVGRWRTNYHNQVDNWTRCFPAPDDSVGEVKKPGETDHPGGIPLWAPSTALPWLDRTGRVTDDLYPHARARGGRKPPGRPPQQRTG